jgi:hypothetical protein
MTLIVNVFDLKCLIVKKNCLDQMSLLLYQKKWYLLQLSKEQKEYNKSHSKETSYKAYNCKMNKYNIITDIFKNKSRKNKRVYDIV